jgi:hypothetical protein
MIPQQIRFKILTKLAQEAGVTLVKTDQLGNITTPSQPLIAPPPSFVASAAPGWTWIKNVYNSQSVMALDSLVNIANIALHYSSNGQSNFNTLKNDSFKIDSSGVYSVDTKNLLNLSILIYKTFINSGNPPAHKLSSGQIKRFADRISNSQAFLNLYDLNPTGIIAQKIQGTLGEVIINVLNHLETYNPSA